MSFNYLNIFLKSQWPKPLIMLQIACQLFHFISLLPPPFMLYERPGQKVLGNAGKAFCPFLFDLHLNSLFDFTYKTANLTPVKLNQMYKILLGF
jgi:hypothetical protein